MAGSTIILKTFRTFGLKFLWLNANDLTSVPIKTTANAKMRMISHLQQSKDSKQGKKKGRLGIL
jgi:hypothetical protein